jgi:hypothetical protein
MIAERLGNSYIQTIKNVDGDILRVSTSGNGYFFESASLYKKEDLELNREPQYLNKQQTENVLNYWQAKGILA